MRFSDIVKDSDGAVYRRIKFCHISTGNVNMAAWKPEVHFRKSAKSRVPDSKSLPINAASYSEGRVITGQ